MVWTQFATAPDVITEWWTSPVATELDGRTVSGGLSSNGTVQVVEVDHATGQTTVVPAAFAGQDDHNAPALWAEIPGRRMLLAWNEHGEDTLLKVKVSDRAGAIQSLQTAPVVAFDFGSPTSYAIIHRIRHLCTDAADVFWVFCRVTGASWRYVPVTVDQASGAVTFGAAVPLFTAAAQSYLSVADAHASEGQVLRMTWGYSPHVGFHAVRYYELDVITGQVLSPMDGDAVVANVVTGTGLPVLDTATPLLPEPPEGWSRWMFYVRPGPSAPAVAYADWEIATPHLATYKVTTLTGTSRITREYGPAGPKFGYTDNSNYLASMGFPNPCPEDVVAVAAQVDGRDSVRIVRTDEAGSQFTTEVLASTTQRLVRPVFPVGSTDRLHVSRINFYGDTYFTYSADMVAMVNAVAPAPATTTDRSIRIVAGELRTGLVLDHNVPVTDQTRWEVVHRGAGTVQPVIPLLAQEARSRPELLRHLQPARCFLGVAVGDELLEAGPIWLHSLPDAGRGLLTVKATGLPSLFDRRIVMGAISSGWAKWAVTYTGSLGTIAKRLVQLALSHTGGSLPIVLPADESGSSEYTYEGFDLATVWERVSALMGVINGPDVAFAPRFTADGRSVEWVMRVGTTTDPLLHQDGPDWVWDAAAVRGSTSGLAVSVDGTVLTNRSWATGEGMDEALLIRRAQDAAAWADGMPLLESVEGYSTVKKSSTLQAHADADLRYGSAPEMTWGLTVDPNASPLLGTYRPGDFASVWTPEDHPYLRYDYPSGRAYRTRVARISGGASGHVQVALMPTREG
jgi:hypothetical protein